MRRRGSARRVRRQTRAAGRWAGHPHAVAALHLRGRRRRGRRGHWSRRTAALDPGQFSPIQLRSGVARRGRAMHHPVTRGMMASRTMHRRGRRCRRRRGCRRGGCSRRRLRPDGCRGGENGRRCDAAQNMFHDHDPVSQFQVGEGLTKLRAPPLLLVPALGQFRELIATAECFHRRRPWAPAAVRSPEAGGREVPADCSYFPN